MKIAVMQPYFFPYLGYFQLIAAVDKFVVYDDVNYIKKGWIDRNRILSNHAALYFKAPTSHASQNKFIKDTLVNQQLYPSWVAKFSKTLYQSYGKAPFFHEVRPVVESVLNGGYENISQLATQSLIQVCKYLDIRTEFVPSSEVYNNRSLERAERLIDICKREGAKEYINAPGGKELYQKQEFEEKGIKLFFIESSLKPYNHFTKAFIPGLSIIDVLMFNSKEEVKEMLQQYRLV